MNWLQKVFESAISNKKGFSISIGSFTFVSRPYKEGSYRFGVYTQDAFEPVAYAKIGEKNTLSITDLGPFYEASYLLNLFDQVTYSGKTYPFVSEAECNNLSESMKPWANRLNIDIPMKFKGSDQTIIKEILVTPNQIAN
ncbi:hypothetical protein [Bacillus cereus]|uniref:Uncharacterized protein n=1 Tax=Bacillus cereus TaxID=1396 RepID=A0A164NCJ5_BACCE|nr:hypothetical protein [Bacillus cereus]KZD63350.1 hypothetical protein B4088_3335 [Bacillus cereus]